MWRQVWPPNGASASLPANLQQWLFGSFWSLGKLKGLEHGLIQHFQTLPNREENPVQLTLHVVIKRSRTNYVAHLFAHARQYTCWQGWNIRQGASRDGPTFVIAAADADDGADLLQVAEVMHHGGCQSSTGMKCHHDKLALWKQVGIPAHCICINVAWRYPMLDF